MRRPDPDQLDINARGIEERRNSRQRLLRLAGVMSTALLLISTLLLALPSTAFADVSVTAEAPPGADGLQDLLNWTLYAGAMACAATAMYGFAKMGLSHSQQSYQGANHGKAVAILGLVGALGLGLTPTLVNALTAIH